MGSEMCIRDRSCENSSFNTSVPPGFPSATIADLDALGGAAELQFGDSTARYSHADWAREQQAEPACYADMRYTVLGRPPALLADVLCSFPPLPLLVRDSEALGIGRLHTTDDGIVLLIPQMPPLSPLDLQRPVGRAACLLNDQPVRIYVPLVMRPWNM